MGEGEVRWKVEMWRCGLGSGYLGGRKNVDLWTRAAVGTWGVLGGDECAVSGWRDRNAAKCIHDGYGEKYKIERDGYLAVRAMMVAYDKRACHRKHP
jgi:hypothetical protein